MHIAHEVVLLFCTVNLYILKSIVCTHLPVGNLYQSRHNDILIPLQEGVDLLSNWVEDIRAYISM